MQANDQAALRAPYAQTRAPVRGSVLGLHPQRVGIQRILDRPHGRTLGAPLVPVVPLTRSRRIPVPMRHGLEPKLGLCNGDRVRVRCVRHPV